MKNCLPVPLHMQQKLTTRLFPWTYHLSVVLYCGRFPAANAPRCTAAEGLLYKPWSLVVPTCTARCLHQRPLVVKGGTESCDFHAYTFGFFYVQICDMGQTALLPFRRKACWGFFSPWKIRRLRPGLNPRTWVPKVSPLTLDHRSRYLSVNLTIPWILLGILPSRQLTHRGLTPALVLKVNQGKTGSSLILKCDSTDFTDLWIELIHLTQTTD